MTQQQLMSLVRKAVDTYQMIESGDKVCVGVSGGKDSLALAWALQGLKRFYPNSFDLVAITVSVGFPDMDLSPIKDFFADIELPYHIVETNIADVVFNERKEDNPCSLCSKMRKGALNQAAKELGCNKIALGHNMEDVVESFLMSLRYEGRLHTFSPVTHWDHMDLYAIRPLIMVHEQDLVYCANKNALPVVKNTCPVDGKTTREDARKLLEQWNSELRGTTDRIFNAIVHSDLKGWSQHELS